MPRIDLFAVQTSARAADYTTDDRFRRWLGGYFERCDRLRAGGPALAVFPENLATFLTLRAAGRIAEHLRSPAVTMLAAIARRPGRFAPALRRFGLRRANRAVLVALSDEVRRSYEQTFSSLARRFGLATVAGSALLADPDGAVYNESACFDERGRLVGRTRKVNLVPGLEDVMDLSRGADDALVPVPLSVGPVGTLICYDGFSVAHTRHEPGFVWCAERLSQRGARILAHPSANPYRWDGTWLHAAADAPILRREQWHVEGLTGQLARMAPVRYAVTAHLCGELLDVRFEGRSEIVERTPAGAVRTVAAAAQVGPDRGDVVHANVEAEWLGS